jgi:cellulose synthase/poly-beta-1,6-N-acetylglucosamine synthase-like glycosyltransferase
MMIAAVVLGIGVSAAVYAYLLFPVLAAWFARCRPGVIAAGTAAPLPVTVIIPAHNEERNIGPKIQNVLDSEYPADLLQVIVVSDASTDATDDIARRFERNGVQLLVQERRQGKTAGLNRAMALARGELVVFTDANAVYPPSALAALGSYFRDSRVGLVSGYTKYTVDAAGHVADATNAYTSLERIIKRGESSFGCCVGADGAIFAMRRTLYRVLRDDDINDFVLPLSVIGQGYRCLFAEDAYCSEHPGKDLESEFRRQSRITNRTLRALWRHAGLLNPFRFPAFSFFLFSHKVARFFVPVLLLPAAAALAWLTVLDPLSRVAAAGALAAFLMAGALNRRLFRFVPVFLSINLAMLEGWRKFLTGRADVTWQHDRSTAAGSAR